MCLGACLWKNLQDTLDMDEKTKVSCKVSLPRTQMKECHSYTEGRSMLKKQKFWCSTSPDISNAVILWTAEC